MVKISDAELEVMKVIWEKKEATSSEIIDEVKSFNWKYNTVRTLIKRLQIKGAIKVIKRPGKTYMYIPAIDENKYKVEATKDFVKRIYNCSVKDFVYQYCIDNKVSAEEIQNVILMIEEREKNKEN